MPSKRWPGRPTWCIMHEMSIAQSILDLARSNVPAGAVLRSISVVAGPMRGIDPECMQLAWQAIGQDEVMLKLMVLPWRMRCAGCGKEWEEPQLAEVCSCGSSEVRPVGGDELQLRSIEVDDSQTDGSPAWKSKLSKMS